MRELNHRIRNILALVKGLVQQSAARSDSVEELAATLQNRVGAMARAHMQIEQTRWTVHCDVHAAFHRALVERAVGDEHGHVQGREAGAEKIGRAHV